jgi:hypothetical protein
MVMIRTVLPTTLFGAIIAVACFIMGHYGLALFCAVVVIIMGLLALLAD